MANPQKENGHTDIANEIMEVFCRFRIPGELRQVLDCIIRKTYGYHKKEDWVAQTQIVKMTGLKKGNVSRSLSKLITHKLVIKSDNNLSLNKNYDEWLSFQITRKKVIKTETEVIKSDNKKLSELMVTKENKENIQKKIYSSESIRLTNLLIDLINKNYPFIKPKIPSDNDYNEMEKIERIDGLPPDIIEGVIRWSQQDSFWKQNIRSVGKLREKMEMLLIKIKSGGQNVRDFDS